MEEKFRFGMWLQQMFQDEDGEADEMATLAIIGFIGYMFCLVYSVIWVKDFHFDPQAAGIGLGAAIGAAAAGMGWKSKAEGQRRALLNGEEKPDG